MLLPAVRRRDIRLASAAAPKARPKCATRAPAPAMARTWDSVGNCEQVRGTASDGERPRRIGAVKARLAMQRRAAERNAHAQAEQERRIGAGPSNTLWKRARWPARDADLGALSEIFFVSGVVSLLLTRFYLVLTGFPQLGAAESGLHIAHLLWGGLLMLVALVLLLAFLGRSMQRTAALLGGIGFGLLL